MFHYKEGILHCEDVSVSEIVEKYSSPLYIYSSAILREKVAQIRALFSQIDDFLPAYAVKVNNNLGILRLLVEEGMGADIISDGELYRYLKAGGEASKVVFSGVAKSEEELTYALEKDIGLFNVESINELIRLNQLASKLNKKANFAVRINPDVEAGTHSKITTGKKGNKFGISVESLKNNIELIKSLENVNMRGLAVHIGSQILQATPFKMAFETVSRIFEELRKDGFNLDTLDIGGGFGIPYKKEDGSFDFDTYKKEVIPILRGLGVRIIAEPGRFIAAEAGAFIMRVEYIKHEWDKNYIIVDGGMNDFARVAMYDAYHEIIPISDKGERITADVVGPVCESSDYFAKDRLMGKPEVGGYVALMNAGGYGHSMSTNYNGRKLVAEVMVEKNSYKLIRRRQRLEELTMYEEL